MNHGYVNSVSIVPRLTFVASDSKKLEKMIDFKQQEVCLYISEDSKY